MRAVRCLLGETEAEAFLHPAYIRLGVLKFPL